jgi:ubiquinone/menaquinone biosynthesis C-methylase UbiE
VNLAGLQRNWDLLGRADPLWAILFDPAKRGNRWRPEEFFATGRQEVARLLADLERLGVRVRGGRALDFGCGAGRLTQALAEQFEQVDGVDIAPSMLALAERSNRHGRRCRYHLNASEDLALFGDATFDLACSLLVLQHVEPRYARGYLAELLRVLRPGGVLVVGLPSHPRRTLRGRLFALLPNRVLNVWRRLRYRHRGVMELHGMRREQVEALLRAAGGRVVEVASDDAVGRDWHAYRYVAVRRQPL